MPALRPIRVRLRRERGWSMPPNTVNVDRSTKWGNPYVAGTRLRVFRSDEDSRGEVVTLTPSHAVSCFRFDLIEAGEIWRGPRGRETRRFTLDDAVAELRGRNLACWCALDQPCHADILLELANR